MKKNTTVALKNVYQKLEMFNEKGHRILELLSGAFLGLSTLAILFQVLYRFAIVHFISFSFPFTEEFARYSVIWSAYLIIGVCLSEGSHVAVDILLVKLPPKGKIINYIIVRLIMVFFLVTVLIASKDLIILVSRFKTPTLRWPSHILYFSVVFGCFSILWEIILDAFGIIIKEKKPLYGAELMSGVEII